jgi:hypothetical protein
MNKILGEHYFPTKEDLEGAPLDSEVADEKTDDPYVETYRNCGSHQSFMESIRNQGLDEEQADALWHDLTLKYAEK